MAEWDLQENGDLIDTSISMPGNEFLNELTAIPQPSGGGMNSNPLMALLRREPTNAHTRGRSML